MSAKLLITVFVLCYYLQSSLAATDTVVCYYASWAVYRPGDGQFTPEDIDANICTHVYYAFLGVDTDGSLLILDPWNEINLEGFAKVAALKETNPDLKTILSIGGWNAGYGLLNNVVGSPELRANLAASSIEFFETYGFDGLDISWEYPTAVDKDNFIILLQELKSAFEAGGYLLTVGVPAMPIDEAYDVPGMSSAVDLINLMTYDFHMGDGVTGENSPLYASSSDDDVQKESQNVNASVVNWLDRGAEAEKLTIGLGFYGHSFTLVDPDDHGIGAPVSGVGNPGPYTQAGGTLGYNEICALKGDWERVWDEEQEVPYEFNGDQWVGYDDEESIASKVEFAKSNKLAGVMIWSVDMDDFLGLCGSANGLLEAVKSNL